MIIALKALLPKPSQGLPLLIYTLRRLHTLFSWSKNGVFNRHEKRRKTTDMMYYVLSCIASPRPSHYANPHSFHIIYFLSREKVFPHVRPPFSLPAFKDAPRPRSYFLRHSNTHELCNSFPAAPGRETPSVFGSRIWSAAGKCWRKKALELFDAYIYRRKRGFSARCCCLFDGLTLMLVELASGVAAADEAERGRGSSREDPLPCGEDPSSRLLSDVLNFTNSVPR